MLKDTLINQGTLYLGRHAGKEIHEKIKAAQHSIKVITLYISNEYIDLLKGKAQKGLDVKLIVSSDIGGKKDKYEPLKKLISQEKHTDVELKEKRQKYIGPLLSR
jgi:predicted transcriptional regulator